MGVVTEFVKELRPPHHDSTPEAKTRWRYYMFGSILVIATIGAWGFGFTPIPGGPVESNAVQLGLLTQEVAGVKDSIVCSNLKGQIDRNRTDLYELDREIESAGSEVSELTLRRRNELRNTLNDNDAKFRALGCVTVLA